MIQRKQYKPKPQLSNVLYACLHLFENDKNTSKGGILKRSHASFNYRISLNNYVKKAAWVLDLPSIGVCS